MQAAHITVDQMPGTQEREAWTLRGEPILVALLALAALGVVLLLLEVVAGIALIVLAALAAPGLVAVQPNETKVLIVFGRYTGTMRRPGLSYTNPLSAIWRTNVSVRVRNFQTERSKVNDASGSPIIIAAAIVAARKTIVEGAVGLVDMALDRISEKGIVDLDDERKAGMVSNLMVVLTGDRAPTPVINTGTLYGS